MKITILDYTVGLPFCYTLNDEQMSMDSENLVEQFGHDSSNCYWLYHK